MSVYTDAEHAISLQYTRRWDQNSPDTPFEWYLYGCCMHRQRDYNRAIKAFVIAEEKIVPARWYLFLYDFLGMTDEMIQRDFSLEEDFFEEAEPLLKELCTEFNRRTVRQEKFEYWESERGRCVVDQLAEIACSLTFEYGIPRDGEKAAEIWRALIEYFSFVTEDDFHIATAYTVEGSHPDKNTDACLMPLGFCWYGLAILILQDHEEKTIKNKDQIRAYLRRSYDCHCEEALLTDYRLYGQNWEKYEYQREIIELSGFRLGQFTRVAEQDPRPLNIRRVVDLYRMGFPGDTDERDKQFRSKAEKWDSRVITGIKD